MTASNSRKRHHSPDQEIDDCLPISKRIHRLQIEPEGRNSAEEEYKNLMRSDNCNDHNSPEDRTAPPWHPLGQNPGPVIGGGDLHSHSAIPMHGTQPVQQQCLMNSAGFMTQQTATNHVLIHDETADQGRLLSINDQDMDRYSPELEETDNPHYFQINRLLYDANSSRLLRSRSTCRLLNSEQNHMS